mmetsp:Transcript_95214/g.254585  ORF Transcript_95214/g.254585 Transcript_95214/m.254585 type:complete len:677 (-) Transcript_95214:52-2082(-)
MGMLKQKRKKDKRKRERMGIQNERKEKKGKAGQGARIRREKRVAKKEGKEQEALLNHLKNPKNKKKKRKTQNTIDPDCSDSDQEEGDEKVATTVRKDGQKVRLLKPDFADAPVFDKEFWEDPDPLRDEETMKRLRQLLGIKVRAAGGPLAVPAPVESLRDQRLPEAFSKFFRVMEKFSTPTPIQMQCWPAVLGGRNVLGIAPTGSGKTLAYLLPLVPHAEAQVDPLPGEGPIALVVLPTRELATQVCEAARPLRRLFSIVARAIYGGQDKAVQVDALGFSGHHLLTATPGRLVDLMGLNALSLQRVTYFVLDEADRMLALGFEEQLHAISEQIRPDRQTLMFSATFPGALRAASEKWLSDPVLIRVATTEVEETNAFDRQLEEDEPRRTSHLAVSPTIEQVVKVCSAGQRTRKLVKFVNKVRSVEKDNHVRQPAPILIFCNVIKKLRQVASVLEKAGIKAEPLHGQLPQMRREATLGRFKAGQTNVLVASDVAARGLHIARLGYVVNFDMPSNLEQYTHRIGRTGRSGAKGVALTFFTPNYAPLAGPLVNLLSSYGQIIDPELIQLRDEAAAKGLTADDLEAGGSGALDPEQEDDEGADANGDVDMGLDITMGESDGDENGDGDEDESMDGELAAMLPGTKGVMIDVAKGKRKTKEKKKVVRPRGKRGGKKGKKKS